MKLWQAADHDWGRGKIHIVDEDDGAHTLCRQPYTKIDGRIIQRGSANCIKCHKAIETRAKRAADEAEWQARAAEHARTREAEAAAWRQRYEAHLQSPKWRELRHLVLSRAGGVCEGCGKAPAHQVHHMSYRNLGNEFLWELKAVCRSCHERWHQSEVVA